MSLAVALNNARSSLMTTAKQIAVSSSNINGADDPDYVRRIAQPSTDATGASNILQIRRASDPVLQQRVYTASAASAGQQAVMDGLDRLAETIGDTDSEISPAARMAAMVSALGAYADAPSDANLAQAAISAARSLATSLNDATDAVTTVRTDADNAIAAAVDDANDLLAQIARLNDVIVTGTNSGRDVSSELDQRDAAIRSLGEILGIKVMERDSNDVAIFTDSGVPLFDKTARTVSFQSSTLLAPGQEGNAVMIDGMPVTGSSATMQIQTGLIAGLAELRDGIAPTYQAQLDEMARGLIEATAELDQSGLGQPALAGLFTWSGGPALPASGTLSDGIAGAIMVNTAVDPSAGGSVTLLRDGGINGTDYLYNVSGAASFADRLEETLSGLAAERAIDPAAAIQSSLGLADLGTSSMAWLQELRQSTSTTLSYQETLLARATETLSNASGVNIDEEYAKQLELEQSYAASSKLIAVVNELFDVLMAAVS